MLKVKVKQQHLLSLIWQHPEIPGGRVSIFTCVTAMSDHVIPLRVTLAVWDWEGVAQNQEGKKQEVWDYFEGGSG